MKVCKPSNLSPQNVQWGTLTAFYFFRCLFGHYFDPLSMLQNSPSLASRSELTKHFIKWKKKKKNMLYNAPRNTLNSRPLFHLPWSLTSDKLETCNLAFVQKNPKRQICKCWWLKKITVKRTIYWWYESLSLLTFGQQMSDTHKHKHRAP